MKQLDDLLMPFLAAAVIVSPFAGLGRLLAPLEAHALVWTLASSGSDALWG
jgi:2-polyprenyl-6-methoxyphenol hydroxylase-like FAD-dependent oxidoreductase